MEPSCFADASDCNRQSTMPKSPLQVVTGNDTGGVPPMTNSYSRRASTNEKNLDACSSSSNNNDVHQESCPICREEIANLAYADGCFHKFCRVCIMEWLKCTAQKPHCPVCRAAVTKVLYNVRSNADYDEYKLPKPPPSGIPGIDFGTDAQGRRFRFGTTMTPERRMYNAVRNRFFNEVMRMSDENIATSLTTEEFHRIHMVLRRRVFYEHGLRVIPIVGAFSRNIRPEFFATHEAAMHRLMPWLARELRVILGGDQEATKPLYDQILTLVRTIGIENPDIRQRLEPAMGTNTDHFLHEFRTFARSPYTMDEWDRMARYPPLPDNDDEVRELIPMTPPPEITINDDSPEILHVRGENLENLESNSDGGAVRRSIFSFMQRMNRRSSDDMGDSPRLSGSELTPPELSSIGIRSRIPPVANKQQSRIPATVGNRSKMNEIEFISDDEDVGRSPGRAPLQRSCSPDYYRRVRSPSPMDRSRDLFNDDDPIRSIWDDDDDGFSFDAPGPSWRPPPNAYHGSFADSLRLPDSPPVASPQFDTSPARSDELEVIAEMKPKHLRTPEVVDLLNDEEEEEKSNSSSGPSRPHKDGPSQLQTGEHVDSPGKSFKHRHKKHHKHRSKSREKDGRTRKHHHHRHRHTDEFFDRHQRSSRNRDRNIDSRGESSGSSSGNKSKSSDQRRDRKSRESSSQKEKRPRVRDSREKNDEAILNE